MSAVFASWAMAYAVGKDRLQEVEIGAPDVDVVVDHKSRQVLPHALTHDARFTVIDAEVLFAEYGGDVSGEPLGAPFERFAAGDSEIVRVTCIGWRLPPGRGLRGGNPFSRNTDWQAPARWAHPGASAAAHAGAVVCKMLAGRRWCRCHPADWRPARDSRWSGKRPEFWRRGRKERNPSDPFAAPRADLCAARRMS